MPLGNGLVSPTVGDHPVTACLRMIIGTEGLHGLRQIEIKVGFKRCCHQRGQALFGKNEDMQGIIRLGMVKGHPMSIFKTAAGEQNRGHKFKEQGN